MASIVLRLDALRLDVARLEKIGAEAGQDRADRTRERPVPFEEAAEKTAAMDTAGTRRTAAAVGLPPPDT